MNVWSHISAGYPNKFSNRLMLTNSVNIAEKKSRVKYNILMKINNFFLLLNLWFISNNKKSLADGLYYLIWFGCENFFL